MSVGPAAERPVIFSFTFTDGKIVDTRNAQAHQAVFIKLPVLVAVAAEPVAAVIVPFISEAHSDATLAKGPHLFDKTVVQLPIPLPSQERFYGFAALQKFVALPPERLSVV